MSRPIDLLIFGLGHIGAAFARRVASEGWRVSATARDPGKRQRLEHQNILAIDPTDSIALKAAMATSQGLLITCAPDDDGCPAFRTLYEALEWSQESKWIGYLSTTGVYGDRDGGWVFEDSPLLPLSREGKNRVKAEAQWATLKGVVNPHRVDIFRLPGLYGPGRSVFDKLISGEARRIIKPGQVFSRLHEDDCAEAVWRAFGRNRAQPSLILNLCDDEPAPADEVMAWAAQTYGFDVPTAIAFDDPALSPGMRRFYAENKRVSNARAKAVLGWRPRYPTYREGLAAIFAANPRP